MAQEKNTPGNNHNWNTYSNQGNEKEETSEKNNWKAEQIKEGEEMVELSSTIEQNRRRKGKFQHNGGKQK